MPQSIRPFESPRKDPGNMENFYDTRWAKFREMLPSKKVDYFEAGLDPPGGNQVFLEATNQIPAHLAVVYSRLLRRRPRLEVGREDEGQCCVLVAKEWKG